jgi:hypothetical protein
VKRILVMQMRLKAGLKAVNLKMATLKPIAIGLLGLFAFVVVLVSGERLTAQEATPIAPATPVPTTEAVPVPALPGSATTYQQPTPQPSPTVPSINPTASPTASPTPGTLPGLPTPSLPVAPPPLPAADPLPTAGEFNDPKGRFRVAILQDYRVSPIGDAVLIENKTGSLAYTALTQPSSGFLTPENLVELAKATFQRGEAFQAGTMRAIPGGIQLDWSGSLTIGGVAEPVNGVIIAKPTGTQVLLLLIAATESGAEKVPNAAAALIDGFQALS